MRTGTQSIVVNGITGGAYPFNNPKGIFSKSFDTVKAGNPRLGGEEDWLVRYNRGPKTNLSFVGLPPMMLIVNLLLQKYI